MVFTSILWEPFQFVFLKWENVSVPEFIHSGLWVHFNSDNVKIQRRQDLTWLPVTFSCSLPFQMHLLFRNILPGWTLFHSQNLFKEVSINISKNIHLMRLAAFSVRRVLIWELERDYTYKFVQEESFLYYCPLCGCAYAWPNPLTTQIGSPIEINGKKTCGWNMGYNLFFSSRVTSLPPFLRHMQNST